MLEKYKVNEDERMYYKVYDENGHHLYNIDKSDEKNLIKGVYLKVVTCFVVNDKGEVLVEKRANTELSPGELDLVSGHVEQNEVGIQTVIRELEEEVGIPESKAISACKIGNQVFESAGNSTSTNFFTEIFYLFLKDSEVKANPNEVEKLEWIPMEKVFEMIKQGKTRFPKQGEEINYEPIFDKVKQLYSNKHNKKDVEIDL